MEFMNVLASISKAPLQGSSLCFPFLLSLTDGSAYLSHACQFQQFRRGW